MHDTVGEVSIEFDAPVMESGMDSMMAVDFRNALQEKLDTAEKEAKESAKAAAQEDQEKQEHEQAKEEQQEAEAGARVTSV